MMKRAQAGLEYIIIIGTVAAGLIALIFYTSRSHQGNLRSQAEQLSESQYAPGKTEIHNTEHKRLESTLDVTGIGSTKHHEKDPQGEINPTTQRLAVRIASTQQALYEAVTNWENAVVGEAADESAKVRGGAWPWDRPPVPTKDIEENVIPPLLEDLATFYYQMELANAAWEDRKQDETSPATPVRTEDGTITTHKTINEDLGALGELGEE
jgi:hypothetical protein